MARSSKGGCGLLVSDVSYRKGRLWCSLCDLWCAQVSEGCKNTKNTRQNRPNSITRDRLSRMTTGFCFVAGARVQTFSMQEGKKETTWS